MSSFKVAIQNQKNNLVGMRAAVFAALGKVADSESCRDDLEDGAKHEFHLTISGVVNGCGFEQSFAGDLSVGHASERASSVGPNQDHLLAYVLSKMNHQTREKILRETASDFAEHGELPAVADEQLKAAKEFRGELRQKVSQHVRGSVRVNYGTAAPAAREATKTA